MVRFCGAYQLLRFTHRRYRKVHPAVLFKQQYDFSPRSALLGTGKFGNVYSSKHRQSGREVAVKLIANDGSRDAHRAIEMFQLETAILRNLRHCGVINQVFSFATKKYMIVVMERMEGTLFSYITNQKNEYLSERTTKFIARQIFSALDYLHLRDIVHCDVKPENVLLSDLESEFPQTKLCDFGLAKRIQDREYSQKRVGTWQYLAPEVIECKEYTKAVDIWAMGVLIYASLTGVMPFKNPINNVQNIYKRLSRMSSLFPAMYCRHVSVNAKNLIRRILNAVETERPTADECITDIWMDDPIVYVDLRQLEIRLNTGRYLTTVEEDLHFEWYLKTRGVAECASTKSTNNNYTPLLSIFR